MGFRLRGMVAGDGRASRSCAEKTGRTLVLESGCPSQGLGLSHICMEGSKFQPCCQEMLLISLWPGGLAALENGLSLKADCWCSGR